MKKITGLRLRLQLDRQTIRALSTTELRVGGGITTGQLTQEATNCWTCQATECPVC